MSTIAIGKNDERKKKQTKQSKNKVVYKVRDINREIKDQKKSKSKSLQRLDDTLLTSWEVRTLFLKTNKQAWFLYTYSTMAYLKNIEV